MYLHYAHTHSLIIHILILSKRQDEEERQQLLGRRAARGGALQIDVDEEAQLESVQNSRRVAAEAYETGLAILGVMAGQRDRLKVWGL